MEKEVVKSMPVHESIIYAINRCESWSNADLLAFLIKMTVIPKNHDAILKAWETKMNFLRIGNQGVSEYVLEQKKLTAEKRVEETMPGSFISLKYFKILKKGAKLTDRHGVDWIVVKINCDGLEKYSAHSFKCSLDYEVYNIFHDGKYLRFLNAEKLSDCRICENFI